MVGLGARFVEPQPADLAALYAESDPLAPIIFVLSTGTDPAAGIYYSNIKNVNKNYFYHKNKNVIQNNCGEQAERIAIQ